MTTLLHPFEGLIERFECADARPLPRVAVLCAIGALGGAEVSLLETVAHLRDSYEFHLIVPGEGPLKESAESCGARVWVLPWPKSIAGTGETARRPRPLQMLRCAADVRSFARALSQLLDEIGPSAFITNALKAHVIGSLTRKRKNVPLIWYMRDGLENRTISRKALALLSRRCDLAVCISRYVMSQFQEYVSTSVPTSTVCDIVDLNRFRPGAMAPADLPRTPNEIWFGIVGAITPLKGQDIFIDAAERVLGQLPNAMFAIVGNNPYLTEAGLDYEERLQRRVQNSVLRDRVKFMGFRDDVPEILSQLDVLVQPNRGPEGLGRSVLEAMACGVPVIAVNKWGPAEVIDDEESGLLFAPLDTDRLTAHMLRLGRDESLRKAMGRRGLEWIRRNLDSTELAEKFSGVLSGAIAKAKASQTLEAAA
jgi:glycosyltransferase involved in cell wall biosynthesis